jgi:hypothetical protein
MQGNATVDSSQLADDLKLACDAIDCAVFEMAVLQAADLGFDLEEVTDLVDRAYTAIEKAIAIVKGRAS